MPRLPPSLIWKAHSISPLAAALLPVCRDIPSALTELRWIREHVQSTLTSSSPPPDVRLRRLCKERSKGVPLQYVLGTQPFGNLEIKCRPGVLIPSYRITHTIKRSEPEAYTTHLSHLLKRGNLISPSHRLRIMDFCTGTGCIALLLYSNLSSHFPQLNIAGVDISPAAVSLSNDNLQHNISLGFIPPPSPSRSITFQHSDIFSPVWLYPEVEGGWDVIISNPPYISPHGFDTDCSRSVRNYEPKLAQVPLPRPDVGVRQEDVFYARLLDIGAVVRPKVMLFEVGGLDQALRVVEMVDKRLGMEEWMVEVWRDWPDGRPVDGEETEVRVDGFHRGKKSSIWEGAIYQFEHQLLPLSIPHQPGVNLNPGFFGFQLLPQPFPATLHQSFAPVSSTKYLPLHPKDIQRGSMSSPVSPTELAKYAPKIFDDNGDLWLEVGLAEISCRVCSRALARASPVLKAMLLESSAEAKARPEDGDWVIHLPYNDINAMEYLLNIIHGHVDRIPRKLPHGGESFLITWPCNFVPPRVETDILYLLTKVADEYKVTHLLKPWAKSWLEMVVLSAFIGNKWNKARVETLLVLDFSGGVVNPSDDENESGEHAILRILKIRDQLPGLRLRVLQALLSPIRSFLYKPLTYIDPGCGWHMQLDGPGNDREVIMQAFEQALSHANLFPLPGPQTFKGSAKDLQKSLQKVEQEFAIAARSFSLLCDNCRPLKRVMDAVRGALGSRHLVRLSPTQRAHLARQREASGIGEVE
ncbi:hypothetical protein BR93DRAFT_936231 [Coniochaeta sp. PMI_546]|nr:hypothetical protein BR93DRAFT_936231 [Coniochaeta sp. PMI_546]